ncbi:MAG: hypothetical protein AB1635_05500 [Acidobacteriota bacterium]
MPLRQGLGFDEQTTVWLDAGSCEEALCPRVVTYIVGPGSFNTLGMSIVAGREFTERDRQDSNMLAQVAIVSFACLAPALRAARADPLTVLRSE